MADEPKRPKFKIKAREEAESVTPQASELPEPAEPLKLRSEDAKSSADLRDQGTEIEHILNEAYGPGRIRDRRKARKARQLSWTIQGSLILLVVTLTLAYGHLIQTWPTIEPLSWYLPIVIVAGISGLSILHGIRQFLKARSFSMLIFGFALAAALSYWNALMFESVANLDAYRPNDPLADYGGNRSTTTYL